MKYNMKFEQDVKKIRLITDAGERRKAIESVAKAYGVSDKTIYRHLKKNIPSLRKVRSDSGIEKKPVTRQELAVVSELVKAGKSRNDAKIMLNMSRHKLQKASNKIKAVNITEVPSKLSAALKEFLIKYFHLEYISDSSVIPVKLGKRKIELTKDDANDIVMVLCNAGNRTADENNKLRFDRMEYMRSLLTQKLEEKIRQAREQSNSDEMKKLLDMHQKLASRRHEALSPNFRVLEAILKDIKPDITFDEIFSLVEKHSS